MFSGGKIIPCQPPNTNSETEHRENVKLIVEILGLIVVVIYSGLTGWQAYESWQTAKAATAATSAAITSYETTVRPYIETTGVGINTKYTPIMFTYDVAFKNYGTIPAQNVVTHLHVVYDGKDQPQNKEPDSPGILPPGEATHMIGNFGTIDAPKIISGEAKLIIYSDYSYTWRDKHDAGCGKYSYYHSAHTFMYLGPTCYPN